MRSNRTRRFRKKVLENASLFEIFKNIMEIIALFIGASWALYNFQLKDAPTLENSVASSCELGIDSLNRDKNIVKYIVHLKNLGKTSFEVDSVQIKYWLLPVDIMVKDKLFSALRYMRSNSASFSMTDYGFTYHYSPDKECIERYNLFVEQKPDYVFLIGATFFLHGRKGLFSEEYFMDNTYSFKLHCVHD